LAAVSTAWFTTLRRDFTPPPGPAHSAGAAHALASRRVVALTDFSAPATNAAWRAALVARDLGLPLHIVAMRQPGADGRKPRLMLEELTRELRLRLRITALSSLVHGDPVAEIADTARSAALIVVRASGGNRVANWLFGSLAQRLVRRCRTPVLAVRRPALASYRRVVVSVALDAQACELIAAARPLSRDPRMQVLHVLGTGEQTRMLLADTKVEAVRRHCEQSAAAARQTLAATIAAAGTMAEGAVPVTAFGHVATALLEKARRSRAQLLVVGQPPRSALAELLLGGVARWLLPATQADVLLVPLARSSGETSAGGVPRAVPS
jgi:nucleotide-binding universal stress UspA family protein